MEKSTQKKILLLCATSKMVLSFRTDLIKKFQKEGYQVGVCAFDDDFKKQIEDLGVVFYCTSDNNRSINPFKILSLKSKYVKIIKDFNPEVVFTFMLKPNVFGPLACKSLGVKKVYSMVEGAGDTFVKKGIIWSFIRAFVCSLYKKAFKISNEVFFLNEDDKAEFIQRKLVKEEKANIIGGIGVNLEKFSFTPIKNYNNFIMVSRLIESKGVIEFCKCAREVKKIYPSVNFSLLGGEGNLTKEDIKDFIDDNSVNYLGETNSVVSYLQDASVFILPSRYREGLPMSIMEAESVGRAIITTDNVGCRDAIKEGFNGFLVPVNDICAIKEKCVYFIENPDKVEEMGKNSRQFAEQNFDQIKINQKLFDVING